MTIEKAVKSLLEMRDGMPFDKCQDWIDATSMAIRSLKAWDEVKRECWDEGHNFTGEYQGVWVRFKDIERIVDNNLKEVEE